MTTNEVVASDIPPAVLVLSCLELKGLSLCMSDPATRPGVYVHGSDHISLSSIRLKFLKLRVFV